jgi:integrase
MGSRELVERQAFDALRVFVCAIQKLGDKRINNILAVLSKPLKYAVDCEVLAKAPRIGMFKVERPEIVAWDFEQYARLLTAAKSEGDEWYAGVCLSGDAGLRVGEVIRITAASFSRSHKESPSS